MSILEKTTKKVERIVTPGDPSLKYTDYYLPDFDARCFTHRAFSIEQILTIKCKVTLCEALKPLESYPTYDCGSLREKNRFNICLTFMDEKSIVYLWSSKYQRPISELEEHFDSDCRSIANHLLTLEALKRKAIELDVVGIK